MKCLKSVKTLIQTISGLAIFLFAAHLYADPTAFDIIKKMHEKMEGRTAIARMEITITRPRFTRTLLLDSWSDTNQNRSFIRILQPKKDSGIAFLKWDTNLWQYIPRIGKEIKIEGSLMHDSWMGSDFSNDDLVNASSVVDDYTHKLLPSKSQEIYRIELKPKPTATVVWERVVMELRKHDYLPVSQEFYDHKNRLAKRMEFSNYRKLGNRVIPATFVMHTIKNDKTISSTTMNYISATFDTKIPNHIFSKSNLHR